MIIISCDPLLFHFWYNPFSEPLTHVLSNLYVGYSVQLYAFHHFNLKNQVTLPSRA